MRLPHVDDVLQWLERRKVVLEVIIAGQNCVLLWDMFFKHETLQWGKLLFLGASLMLLFAIVFLNYLATRKPTKPASDPQGNSGSAVGYRSNRQTADTRGLVGGTGSQHGSNGK